jgi:ferritin-like metal-binding protein YciE
MMSETEDPEAAADRLEAALERIAQAAARDELESPDQLRLMHTEEVAARLDELIDRLRTALGDKAD